MQEWIGKAVVLMVRLDSITYLTGEVTEVTATHITLKRCAWHRQTGRHNEWFAGNLDSTERETYPAEQEHVFRLADCPHITLDWPGKLDLPSV